MQLSTIDFRTFRHIVSRLNALAEALDKNINVYAGKETTFSLPLKKGSINVNLGLDNGSIEYFDSDNHLVKKIDFSYAGHYKEIFDIALRQAIEMDGNRYEPSFPVLNSLEGEYKITLISNSGKLAQTFQSVDTETVLAGAYTQDIQVPSSCNMGRCGSCVSRVISGNVKQLEQEFLNDYQQMAGYILLCCSIAKSECVIETHQEKQLAAMA
jgi:ferredoxin